MIPLVLRVGNLRTPAKLFIINSGCAKYFLVNNLGGSGAGFGGLFTLVTIIWNLEL